MATPSYLGQGQPAATSGGWLSGVFGGNTPSYLGGAVAAPQRTSMLTIAPTYKAASDSTNSDVATQAPAQIAIVIPRQVMDPQT